MKYGKAKLSQLAPQYVRHDTFLASRTTMSLYFAEDWSSEMEVSYVRTGQLSGSKGSGYWNAREQFPALVKMSHEAGVFPWLHDVSAQTVVVAY